MMVCLYVHARARACMCAWGSETEIDRVKEPRSHAAEVGMFLTNSAFCVWTVREKTTLEKSLFNTHPPPLLTTIILKVS